MQRTRGRPWATRRARILSRDCGVCLPCQRAGRVTEAVEVDHIVAIVNGGTDDDDNLQAICKACHEVKTAADLGRAHRPTVGADGWPVE